MRDRLISNIKSRSKTISNKSSLHCIRDLNPEVYIDNVIECVYMYTRPKRKKGGSLDKHNKCCFTEAVVKIGGLVLRKLRKSTDTPLAAKIGAHILYAFEANNLIRVEMAGGENGHGVLVISCIGDDALMKLWSSHKVTKKMKYPSSKPYADWTEYIHATGIQMIKTRNDEVAKFIKPESHPLLFDVLNKAQHIGWMINEEVLALEKWALRTKAPAFNDIWDLYNKEAKKSKTREAMTIMEIATDFINVPFYH